MTPPTITNSGAPAQAVRTPLKKSGDMTRQDVMEAAKARAKRNAMGGYQPPTQKPDASAWFKDQYGFDLPMGEDGNIDFDQLRTLMGGAAMAPYDLGKTQANIQAEQERVTGQNLADMAAKMGRLGMGASGAAAAMHGQIMQQGAESAYVSLKTRACAREDWTCKALALDRTP
jgi:hypothetical protein